MATALRKLMPKPHGSPPQVARSERTRAKRASVQLACMRCRSRKAKVFQAYCAFMYLWVNLIYSAMANGRPAKHASSATQHVPMMPQATRSFGRRSKSAGPIAKSFGRRTKSSGWKTRCCIPSSRAASVSSPNYARGWRP